MSYPGGIAAKHGERYEAQWTVNCVLDMLRGNVDVIKLEPIGGESAGAEFVLTRGDEQEFHQVKRRGAGRWSLSALRVPNKKRFWDAVVVDGVYGETFGQ
jgi:hypothetical protein